MAKKETKETAMVCARVSPELRKRIRVKLAEEEESLQDVMVRLLEEWVNPPKGRRKG